MNIPVDFPLVVAAGLGMSLQTWGFGIQTGRARHTIFNEDFMDKTFGTLHQNQVGSHIEAGGFPDTGSGFYSQRLSYKDWYRFNVLQRIHLNAVEGISLAHISLLSAGLYKPREAALLGLLYIFGRFLYSVGAKSKNVNRGRSIGLAISTLAVLINSGIFLFHLARHLRK